MPKRPDDVPGAGPRIALRERADRLLRPLLDRLEAGAARINRLLPAGKRDKGDIGVMVVGTVLGLGCALFPWYIFMHQEQFGVREFRFSGQSQWTNTTGTLETHPGRVGQPFKTAEMPRLELDVISTGTLGSPPDMPAGEIANQPFPADLVDYRLVHVENGRAMIADDTGLWVVQPGSLLPDASKLRAIEQRDGKWVIVTTADRVIALTR